MTRGELPEPFPPPDYLRWRRDDADVVALEGAAGAVDEAIDEAGSLHDWGAERAERAIHAGRGPLWVTRLGETRVAVRHYRRGGWLAPLLLGDRYLDSPPRPFRELAVSERLRSAGVATPRVVAGVAARAWPGYRADLATRWLEGGRPLEDLLAPGAYPDGEREAALAAGGETVGRAHAAGLDHPDLNVTNLLLRRNPEGRWWAALLDLDRARIVPPERSRAHRNLVRLERSLRKARRAGRIAWSHPDREAFLAGYRLGRRDGAR